MTGPSGNLDADAWRTIWAHFHNTRDKGRHEAGRSSKGGKTTAKLRGVRPIYVFTSESPCYCPTADHNRLGSVLTTKSSSSSIAAGRQSGQHAALDSADRRSSSIRINVSILRIYIRSLSVAARCGGRRGGGGEGGWLRRREGRSRKHRRKVACW